MYCHLDVINEEHYLVRVTTDDNTREIGRFEIAREGRTARRLRADAEAEARRRWPEAD